MILPEKIRYIAVEGVIGVGKTSLLHKLERRFTARGQELMLLEEKFAENPFLEKFYEKPEEYAFQTQLFFLISRQREILANLLQNDLFRPVVMSDYTFDKDRIFALQNLSDDEFSMYETVASALKRDLPRPDFIIYLQAGMETLLSRIRRRNRAMERRISVDYLAELQERFDHYFWHYNKCPVLIVNTDRVDFVGNEPQFEEIAEAIERWPSGTTYFAPEGK